MTEFSRYMFRWSLCLFGLLFASVTFSHNPFPWNELEFTAEAVLLVNLDSGAVLYEKNSDKRLYPASITKLATALFVLEHDSEFLEESTTIEWDDVASITAKAKRDANYTQPAHWLETDATHMGLKAGEVMSLRDLLNGFLVVSANDAGNAIARYLGGSIPNFMEELNAYVQRVGATDTHFMNPHGVHHPKHYTTAWDMALLGREAFKHPEFRSIVRQSVWQRPETNKQGSTYLAQGNKLVCRGKYYYPYAIGGKTGYHSAAKNTIVVAAEKEGRSLLAVLMGCSTRADLFTEAAQLFDAAFGEQLATIQLIPRGVQQVAWNLPEARRPLSVCTQEAIAVQYYPSEQPHYQLDFEWNTDIHLPIKKGQLVGKACLRDSGGALVASRPLHAETDLDYSLTAKLKHSWTRSPGLWICSVLACMGVLYFAVRRS